jgi:hypothetical protein
MAQPSQVQKRVKAQLSQVHEKVQTQPTQVYKGFSSNRHMEGLRANPSWYNDGSPVQPVHEGVLDHAAKPFTANTVHAIYAI